MTASTDWKLALDLLIARASLDVDLASKLRSQPHECCKDNGIILPDDINLVIADSNTLVKTIPCIQEPQHCYKPSIQLNGSRVFNTGQAETEAQTTTEETVEVSAGETSMEVTAAESESSMEAVIVIT